MEEKLLNQIVEWAKNDNDIRAIILEGSMASNSNQIDELSDYDLNIFTDNIPKFLNDDQWFKQFNEVIIFQKEKGQFNQFELFTRLVIYKNIRRMDFSIWPIDALKSMNQNNLYEPYKNAYQVLIDKDNLTKELPKPNQQAYLVKQPTQDEFLTNIYNFYFEILAIAKYLKRQNYFYAKLVEGGYIKQFILQSIIWLEAYDNNWDKIGFKLDGRNLEKEMDSNYRNEIKSWFSDYDPKNTWKSIKAMKETFTQINLELAKKLSFNYPKEKIVEIERLINSIYSI